MMMRLGTFKFALRTAAYQNSSIEHRYRWAPHERLHRAPAYQSLGTGEKIMTLRGTIYQGMSPFWDPLKKLREHAEKNEPLLLIDGRGRLHGKWCIQSLREENQFFERDGDARRTDFQLNLVAYGEDQNATKLSNPRF